MHSLKPIQRWGLDWISALLTSRTHAQVGHRCRRFLCRALRRSGSCLRPNTESLAASLANRKPDGLAIVGTMHTENLGIERLIKNVLANPHIRFLLLCGRTPSRRSDTCRVSLWSAYFATASMIKARLTAHMEGDLSSGMLAERGRCLSEPSRVGLFHW